MKATLYKADGTKQEIAPRNGERFTLSEMQQYVGGYVQLINVRDSNQVMLVDEDGLSKDLPTNAAATIIAYNAFTSANGIVGDVIVCDRRLIGNK